MKKPAALLGLLLSLLTATPAAAVGFVNDRKAWFSMTEEARAAYVQGLNDSLNTVFVDDTLVAGLVKVGRTKCLIDLKLTASTIAERMNFVYRDDRYAGYAPPAIYIFKMAEICKIYVDRERAGFGLGPS